ncbi:hypothetical protein TYRP_011744 [Tyrophagus putrescentiae]|nr:hypothetical protein TYRP_011744 [Tyrophagus putrescentiae]
MLFCKQLESAVYKNSATTINLDEINDDSHNSIPTIAIAIDPWPLRTMAQRGSDQQQQQQQQQWTVVSMDSVPRWRHVLRSECYVSNDTVKFILSFSISQYH